MGRMGFRQSLPHPGPSTQSILTLSLVRPILILTAAIYHHILRQHNTSWGPLAGSFKTTVCGLGTTTLDERFIHSDDLFLHGLRIPRLLPLTSYAPTARKCDSRRNSRFLRPLPLLCTGMDHSTNHPKFSHDTLIRTLRYLTGTYYMTRYLIYYKDFMISYKMQPWRQIRVSLEEVTVPTQRTTHKRELCHIRHILVTGLEAGSGLLLPTLKLVLPESDNAAKPCISPLVGTVLFLGRGSLASRVIFLCRLGDCPRCHARRVTLPTHLSRFSLLIPVLIFPLTSGG